jgi:hypothetical protein
LTGVRRLDSVHLESRGDGIVRMFVVIGALACLAGCSATTMAPSIEAKAGLPPANYREAAVAYAKANFFDPYSVRDASISQPLYAAAVFDGVSMVPRKGWVVCLRGNAKNRMGGYAGLADTVLLFQGETIVLGLDGGPVAEQVSGHCLTAVYSPLPELEST